MIRQIIIAVLLAIGTMMPVAASEIVTFKGEDQEILTARLTKPEGNGPFPAIILLHGSFGFDEHYDVWAERIASWGYVALQMDSFGPRDKLSISSLPSKRAENICYAESYLAGLPFVDNKRIGVIGWSQRGSSALAVFCKRSSVRKSKAPLRAVVAFYPYCFKSLASLDFPLLILTGELDDWCPPILCRERIPSEKAPHEVTLKVYPGAYHFFDGEGVNANYMGHRLLYDPAAAADAIVQVRTFLSKHLK